MHFFGLGKKKEKTKTEKTEDVIAGIEENIDILERKKKYIEKKIDAELTTAKTNATKNKTTAMSALKRKKMLEKQIEILCGHITSLEGQVVAIENAKINALTFQNIKGAKKALGEIHGTLNVEQVDKTMDEIQEQIEITNEISEAVSVSLSTDVNLNETELLEELEGLEQEVINKMFVPENKETEIKKESLGDKETASSNLPEQEEDSDNELKEMQKEMSLL